MALAYLFDPNLQFQDRNGVNNVAGFLRVYYEGTDDRATTYKNFIGTLNPADIPIDNDGRTVVIVEGEKTYRLEVYARNGNLLWTQHPLCPLVGGGGSFEQVQSNWDEDDPTSAAFINNKPELSAVATSGSYDDLSDKPTIPQPGSIAQGEQGYTTGDTIYSALSQLKEVAFSGSYDDLTDKPSIPAAQVNSDWNANSGVAQILNKPNLASVATSGSYNDLSNKPSIPDDSSLVHKSGAETITGIKTFNNEASPRQTGSIFSKQSKVFICSVIKPYNEWSAEEQDNDHFRLWTIDITSIVTVASTHCNIVVKLMGSYYSASANGELQKTITFQVYNGNVIVMKEDYTVAQSPCTDEFVISGIIKSGDNYLLQVTNRNPTANNYPLRLEIEVFNKNIADLDNVTLTESITEGLPSWAVDVAQVTANGSPVLTEATAATVAKTGSYNDLNDRPLPCNIFGSYGPSVEQLTATDVSNGYKDFTYILKYGDYPGRNFTFLTNNALVFVSLCHLEGIVGQSSFPASTFTFEVYAGYESDPTKVLIRSVTKTDLTDTDDRGEPVQDTDPVWNCQLLGSRFLVVCDRITVRVKWKSSSFGSTSNRIKPSFAVAVMNPSGMTEWPQE